MSPLERLARLIEEVSGNVIPDRQVDHLRVVANRRMSATEHDSMGDYVRWLDRHREADEWRELLSRITISESYLFRGPQQFRVISEEIIPELIAHRYRIRRLRVWSAGCARGEEAATLAVIMAESRQLEGWDWQILATDVDEASLEEATRGTFGVRAMARVPADLANRHFEHGGKVYRLKPSLLGRITFRALNLIDAPLDVGDTSYDIVLLRNVLIYFAPDTQRRVVATVAGSLARDGCLFLGPSESLRSLASPLIPRHFVDCFCYRWPAPEPRTLTKTVQGTRDHRTADSTAAAPSRLDLVEQLVRLLEQADEGAARTMMSEAADASPEDSSLRGLEGRILELTGDDLQAVAAYRAALYLEPKLHQVRYLMAGCLARLGRHDRARREYRSVLHERGASQSVTVRGIERLGGPLVEELDELCRQALRASD